MENESHSSQNNGSDSRSSNSNSNSSNSNLNTRSSITCAEAEVTAEQMEQVTDADQAARARMEIRREIMQWKFQWECISQRAAAVARIKLNNINR